MTMLDLAVWGILVLLAIVLLMAIINKKMSNTGNFAATSVFSDIQTREKRNAMETVIEEKSGKKRFEQESGEPDLHSPLHKTKDQE